MNEYKHVQELRQTWSGFIMDWLKIMVPVGAAFDGLFSYLGVRNTVDPNYFCVFPVVGWLLFVIPLITWRVVVHYIDRQIVGLYPRMLELEQQMPPQIEPPMPPPWHTHAAYYFNNLTQQAKEFLLLKILALPKDRAHALCYRQYRQICVEREENLHQLLLKVWDEYGYSSVISRGHKIQDLAVGFICFVSFSIAGILSWGSWIPFTIAIAVSAMLAALFAFKVAPCLVNR